MKLLFYIVVVFALASSIANAQQFQGFMFTEAEYYNLNKWIPVEYDFTVKHVGKEKYEIMATEYRDCHRIVFWVKVRLSRKINKTYEYIVYDSSINKDTKFLASTISLWKMTFGVPGTFVLINKLGGEQQIRLINHDYDD